MPTSRPTASTPGLCAVVDGEARRLADPAQYLGHRGNESEPEALLLIHHGLHIEIVVDRTHPVGKTDPAGVRDVVLEAAVTTIMDLEDSVSTVDVEDKVLAYRNWLRLMQGTLTGEVQKDGSSLTRTLAGDRAYVGADGSTFTLPGRSLLFIRHVGHFMDTDAVVNGNGQAVSEGTLDAFVTALGKLLDHLRRQEAAPDGRRLRNSRTGSMYVVKPKMHGPDEVRLTCPTCSRGSRRRSISRRSPSSWGSWTRSGAPRSTWPHAWTSRANASFSSIPASPTGPATRFAPRCTPVRRCGRAR